LTQIVIFPIGGVEDSITDFLAFSLHENLRIPCSISNVLISIDDIYDIVRKQYYSTKLLERLLKHKKDDHTKLLGVADVDLFIPPLSFVFGEAQVGNTCAVVSTHRLRQEFYGLPQDPSLLLERLLKEAVHELGHTLRLPHCEDYRCAMAPSHAVEWIDLKGSALCAECRRRALAFT